jgi:TRAP-type C4-dicarboxylate transport system substrate-binding protein
MLEPLLMSKQIFDSLPADHQKAILKVGLDIETYALKAAQADDQDLADIYAKAGVKVADFDTDSLNKWKSIAQATAWKDFADRNAACAALLKLAEAVA